MHFGNSGSKNEAGPQDLATLAIKHFAGRAPSARLESEFAFPKPKKLLVEFIKFARESMPPVQPSIRGSLLTGASALALSVSGTGSNAQTAQTPLQNV